MDEFSIIKNFFDNQTTNDDPHLVLGIGDDAALVSVPSGYELAITTDTLSSGVHFAADTSAFDIGYRSLAVNLSDLAAMGAEPKWALLALSLPEKDLNWLKDFSAGFFKLAQQFQVKLIGGDLTRGPLSITIQALGLVPKNKALRRSQAMPGDFIYVTGTLGDAAYTEYKRIPEPQVETGIQLRDVASAAIDISDGLAADLSHILEQSHVGAKVNVDRLPLSVALQELPRAEAISYALNGGDDYQLCFTSKQALHLKNITQIGIVTPKQGLILHHNDGSKYHGKLLGYKHF